MRYPAPFLVKLSILYPMQPRPHSPLIHRHTSRAILMLLAVMPQLSAHGGALDQFGIGQDSQCGVSMSCTPGGSSGGGSPFPGTQPGPGPAACGPGVNGSPCGPASGTASQGGQGGLDVGA